MILCVYSLILLFLLTVWCSLSRVGELAGVLALLLERINSIKVFKGN